MSFKYHPTGRWACRFVPLLLLGSPAMAKQTFELMTLNDGGRPSRTTLDNSSYPALSASGRYVSFLSPVDDLVATATTQPNIFLRGFGTTTQISVASDGKEGDGASGEISDVSANGCLIVFESAANLAGDDTNGVKDVYRRNLCANPSTITRISMLSDKEQLDSPSGHPDMTPDGNFVVYENEELGIRLLDLKTTTAKVTEISGGKPAGRRPAIADDGSRVVFYSASPLIPADHNGTWDIYLWEKNKGLSLVSTASDGTQREPGTEAADRITEPAISGDGTHASFATAAANLVPGDTNGLQDVFVKEIATGKLVRASVTSTGEQGNGDSPGEPGGRAALSRDGTWVVFESQAENLTGGTGGVARTVLRNLATGETIPLDATGSGGSGSRPAISDDLHGRYVAFYSATPLDNRFDSAGVFRYDRHKLPVAVAAIDAGGPQQPKPGDTVILDGSASSNEANAGFIEPGETPELSYQWDQTLGAAPATLSEANTAKPSFAAPRNGSYLYRLIVSDEFESSDPAEVVVHVGTRNKPPVADAGADPGGAEAQSVVRLDGRGSADPEGRPLHYYWSQTTQQSTAAAPLYRANSATPSFVPGQAGTYVFKLRVDDGRYISDPPSTVSITVAQPSLEGLLADPGEDVQDQLLGARYRLDGSGSLDRTTGNSEGLSYSWRLLSAPSNQSGAMARFPLRNPHSAYPHFVPPLPGIYTFALTVAKNGARSTEKSVTVSVGGRIASVNRPTSDEVWTMGGNDPGTAAWQYAGIAPSRKFVVLLYSFKKHSEDTAGTPAGPCTQGCLLQQGIKAGSVNSREIKVPVSRAKALAGYKARVVVCLPRIGRNDALCDRSAEFTLE